MIINNKINQYQFLFRSLLTITIFFVISPPINSWIKLILLSLSILIIFTSKFKDKLSYNFTYVSIFLILFIPKFYISNNSIILNHIVLPTSATDQYDYVKTNFDKEMSAILKKELDYLEKKEILFKKINQPGSYNLSSLYKDYAFQAENIWSNLDEGKRLLPKKKFHYWDLGPSSLNDRNLNFGDTKKKDYATNLIFPVLYKINFSKLYDNAKLCFKGNLIYKENKYQIIKEENFRCIELDKNIEYYFIDFKQNLEFEIKKNFLYENLNYIFYFLIILQLSLIFNFFIRLETVNFLYVFLNSSFFLILFIYLYFSQLISGFSETIYFNRGSDAMAHYGFARIILNNLIIGNFYEAFRGGVDSFYYMPLLRYINSFLMIFFGDTILGTFFIISFFGIFVYKILNILKLDKIAFILTLVFMFFPIFEALGFNIINYIGITVDGYGEGLAYFFLLFFIYIYFLNEKNNFHFFIFGFLSFLIIGLRPNYLVLLFSLIISYSAYIIYLNQSKKKFKKIISNIFFMYLGSSFFFLFLTHNLFYSGEFALLVTKSNLDYNQVMSISDYLILFKSILEGNLNYEIMAKIIHHLRSYIKPYEIWFMITLINLVVVLFLDLSKKIKILSISTLLMHSTYFLFLGNPRYSLGTWLISFMILIYSTYFYYYPFLKVKFFQKSNRLR